MARPLRSLGCSDGTAAPERLITASEVVRSSMMRVFDVYVNGIRLCVAGVDGDGVLTAILDSVRGKGRDELGITVAGIDDGTGEHVTWTGTPLEVGDEVLVKVLDAGTADAPYNRERIDPQRELDAKKTYVREMARHFGWTLNETPEAS